MKKKFLATVAAFLIAFGSFNGVYAASRDEIAAIHVQNTSDFKFWSENSPTKQKIVDFVEDVTNPNSANYIPPEDRIATFDLDGTIYCETAPYYFKQMMFLYRVLEDKNYQPSKDLIKVAEAVKPFIMEKKSIPDKLKSKLSEGTRKAYEGMTNEEYYAYIRDFMNTNEVGLSNLKRGEAFYLPMIEIISYLTNNGFKVYMNSAGEREIVRCLIDGAINIPLDRILGSNVTYISTNQGKNGAEKYSFDRNKEKIVRSTGYPFKNEKNNKVFSIIYEIGKKPVLAFGNSSGDYAMLEYALQDNKYRAESFFVICDDTERELGNAKRAEKDTATALKRGWNPISMHDEFKTIYGDNVKRIN